MYNAKQYADRFADRLNDFVEENGLSLMEDSGEFTENAISEFTTQNLERAHSLVSDELDDMFIVSEDDREGNYLVTTLIDDSEIEHALIEYNHEEAQFGLPYQAVIFD